MERGVDCEQISLLSGRVECNKLKHILPQVISWRQNTALKHLNKRLGEEKVYSITLDGIDCKTRALNEMLDMIVARADHQSLESIKLHDFPEGVSLDGSLLYRMAYFYGVNLTKFSMDKMSKVSDQAKEALANMCMTVLQNCSSLKHLTLCDLNSQDGQ